MIQFSTRFRAIGGASVLAISTGLVASVPAPALAQAVIDETVEERQTVPGGGTLDVTSEGAIEVIDDDAVEVEGDDAQITNAGTIRSFGGRAIDARDVDGTIIDN
ncbi:MAG: hypothetical protein RIC51_04920, partial [Erythrobacter sp.]